MANDGHPQPSPSGDNPFYVTGGTLPPAAPSYITRQADTDLYESLRAGQFCYVLNTRQIGKSSLMIRTVRRLQSDGASVVVLDLTAVGQNLSAEQWYDGLMVMLSEQLRLEDDCEDFWNDHPNLGPMQRFFAAVKEVVLPAIGDRTLIIFVDEIDSVRSLPFSADEFFAGIRECYNRRVQDPVYNRLTFCLLGVALPADLIQDTRVSPFNIGHRITLQDFTLAEAMPLAQGLGANGKKLLERALFWTGGHPYLTQRLCREIVREGCQTVGDVDRLTDRLFLAKRVLDSDDNLSFVQNRLLRSEFPLADILDFYGKVRRGEKIKDDETNPLCGLLRLAGIASVEERTDLLRLRNKIYETVFDRDWVRKNMPDAELRRQRQAAFAASIRVGSVAAAVIALMGLLLVQLKQTAEEARHQAQVAREQKERAETEQRRAKESENKANFAQTVANDNARKAKQSEARARKSEARALIGETRAKQSARIAVAERVRADEAALAARQSEARAIAAKDEEARQRAVAVENGKQYQAQKKLAEKQTELANKQTLVANAERARAEGETDKAKRAAADAEAARRTAEEQRILAVAQQQKAEKAADLLSTYNRKRIERLKAAVTKNTGDVESAVELAAAYVEFATIYAGIDKTDKSLEYYGEAAKAFTVVLERKPGDYPSLAQRGFCFMKLTQYQSAVADFSACIAQRPDDAGNYLNRARAWKLTGKYTAALQDLAHVETTEPAQMDYLLRGQCLMAVNLYEQAVESFSQLLKLKSANPTPDDRINAAEGYAWIGDARRAQGRYDDAYDAYTRYQEFHVERSALYHLRVDCLLASERWSDTERVCVTYRQLFPDTGVMLPWHAYALLNRGDRAGYRALCETAIEKFGGTDATPENANYAAWTCALGANGLRDYAVPLRLARAAVAGAQAQIDAGKANKDDPLGALWNNRNTLAALLLRAGQTDAALRELRACEAMNRTFSPENRFSDLVLFALAYAAKGDRAQALRYLRETQAIPASSDIETRVEQAILLREATVLMDGTTETTR